MTQTRREFLVTSTAALCIASLPAQAAVAEPPPSTHDDPAFLCGDPYIATADHVGLGGRSYDAAREMALRFRSTPDERDRYVLGLEI